MEHIKTLNTKNLQTTVKKVDAVSARLPASPPARHPALSVTRVVNTSDSPDKQRLLPLLIFRGGSMNL